MHGGIYRCTGIYFFKSAFLHDLHDCRTASHVYLANQSFMH